MMFIILFVSAGGYSQDTLRAKKDSIMKVMSREVCKEIVAAKGDITAENLEMSLGLIMMRLMAENTSELQDLFQLNIGDQESMTKFSQDLGMRLVIECPEFMQLVAGKANSQQTEKNEKKTSTLSGSFEKLVPGDITYFLVRAANGKVEKIYWLEYFDGANLLEGKKKPEGKITVQYFEMEVYSAGIKEYVKVKVAAGVTAE